MSNTETKHIDSKKLFEAATVVHIVHNGAVYQLRITKENKLILTK